MRRAILGASACLVLGACSDRAADERVLLQGERDWGQAFVRGDAAVIERLLAADFRGIDTHGKVYDKAAMLRDVRAGPNMTSDTVGPVTIRFYGDTAIAQGTEHEVGPPPDRTPADRVWTDVWVRQGETWRIEAAEDLDPNRR